MLLPPPFYFSVSAPEILRIPLQPSPMTILFALFPAIWVAAALLDSPCPGIGSVKTATVDTFLMASICCFHTIILADEMDLWSKNPYARRWKRHVTIRMDDGTVTCFKDLALEIGVPYQMLTNLYLRECATSKYLSKKRSFLSLIFSLTAMDVFYIFAVAVYKARSRSYRRLKASR
jgi:hypothetical protein